MGLELTFEPCSFLKNVAEESTRVLYSLYGVVEHSGTMRSGHYTAYSKARAANTRLSNLVLRGDIPQGEACRVLALGRHVAKQTTTLNFSVHTSFPISLTDFEVESTKGQWFHISDTHVHTVSADKVLNSQAYLLFYERIL